MTAALPPLIERYLDRVLPDDRPAATTVRLTQVGEMWQKPGGRAVRFRASEKLAVREVAFTWRARFPLVGPLRLDVVDEYRDGAGRLEARVLRFPVMRQRGQETAEAEAMRYLAELAWVPQAIRVNAQLRWREVDERTVEVSATVGPARVAIFLDFDRDGDIVRARTDSRPRPEGRKVVPTAWGGLYGDYRGFGGLRLPTRAEVAWELPEGPFTYWRGEVTSVEVL